ncbi:unnamed protein product [Mytilus edulis]|uniref:Reverse transcriptase/retrotransposon-derived protein RNase H-like domain-containing protein n=1 Tax=Mytilus edulis TaxID=6550 RepID=A0A8S3UZK0_MYTED|nr:unnamed protein product [Mytilus edulis]
MTSNQLSANFSDDEYDSEVEFGLISIKSPETPLLPLPVSISPLSQYSDDSLEFELEQPNSVLSDEFLSLNQLREPDINYLLTPSPKLPLNFSTCNSNLAISDTMEKLANCRKFGGYPHENAALFIAEFESYATLHKISPLDDNRIIAALHLHLTGPALTWFNSLSSENKASWEAIVHLFTDKYVDLDWQNPTVMLDSEIFENMSLSSGQSIDDFYCQLVEKANTLKKPDHEILVKFIKGLPEQLAFFVRAGHHRDSPSALAAAKMGEAYGYRKAELQVAAASKQAKPSDKRDSEFASLQSQIDTLTKAVQNLTASKTDESTKQNRRTDRFAYSRQQATNPPQATNSRQQATYLPQATNNLWALYPLALNILNLKIAALVDTGSSINVISQQLFNSIPETHKSWVNSTSEKIVLANNQSVNIIGVSRIKIQIPQGKHWILVHVFSQTSHPLLLGTDYLVSKKIMLDFSKLTVCSRFCKVKNQKRLSVLPNSEMIVWGKVHNDILHGMQGICTNHNYLFKLGVLTAKSVVSVNKDKLVPVKLFNSTNEIVDIPRGQIVAKFEILDNDSDLIATCIGNRENPEVNNVQFSTEKCEDGELSGTKFFSYFDIPKHLSESEQGQLKGFLKSHDNIFVTDENPALGFTDVVQHKIILKPDFKPKYQRSYRLTPDKKQVLRDHLDHLLKQGIISPGCAEIEPLTKLLRKNAKFRWTSEQENAFTKLKSLLTNSPVLAFPNFHTEFYLAVDTSSKGIGYMLYQYQETASDSKDVSVIRFGSKSLSKWQRSYGPTKLELLGMVTAILDCAMYLRGRKFIVECDHQALRPIFQKQLKGAIYERWVAILQQFNFELRYKPAKDMQVADALSRSTRLTSCEGIDSPDQEDPFFPYVPEHVGDIQFEGKRVKFPNFMDSESTDFQEHNLPEVNNVMQSHDSIRNLKHFKRSKQFQNKQLDFGYDADTEDYDVADQTISKIKSQLPDYIKYQQFTDKCDSEDRNITADTGNRDIPETSSQNIDTENQSESVDPKTSAENQDTEISTEKEDHSNFTTLYKSHSPFTVTADL